MSFDNKVNEWIQIDNQVKKLNESVQQLREKRNALEENLIHYAKTNNMTNSTIQLNKDKLKFVETKVHEPLTFKYLEKSLGEIIKDEAKVSLIMEHLKQKRAYKSIPEIKRYYVN